MRRLVAGILLMGCLASLSGCGEEPQEAPGALPDILSDTEEGFADLTFRITLREERDDGTSRFTAKSFHDGETVGLALVLGRVWKKASAGPGLEMFSGTVRFESIGPESDAFLASLARIYGVAAPQPAVMRGETVLAAVTLGGDPQRVSQGPVRIKCFHEPVAPPPPGANEDEEHPDYAEVFANVDDPARTLTIAEKDPAYREALVRALTAR